jgi:hypothetical protein
VFADRAELLEVMWHQGNRVKFSRDNKACEEIVIPCGGLAQQVLGDVFDGGEIGRGMVGSDAALVVAKDHVHHPMQTVFNCPVAAHDWSQEMCEHHQRGEVKA